MSTLHSIQFFVALNFTAIGLSHFIQPKMWIEFFQYLHKKGKVGNIFNAMLALGMGTIILSFHFVWTWPMLIVTLYGLAQVLKGIIYLTIPYVGLRSIGTVKNKLNKFRWAGLLMCCFGILLIIKLIVEGAFQNIIH